MEGEARFFRRPEVDSATEFYRQVDEYLAQEFERSPELMGEMRAFQRYIALMHRLLPWRLPPVVQDQTARILTRAIEAPVLPLTPITLPLPGRVISVGEHMEITTTKAGEFWPDRKRRTLTLDDNSQVNPETSTGRIDIIRNLPRLDAEAPLIGFTRQLISSSTGSLRELARLSEEDESRLAGIEVFGGTSHLARMGRRFGFTVFDIANRFNRERATAVSKSVARSVSGDNEAWKELSENYKPAKAAFISRNRLVGLFGSKGPDNIRAVIGK